VDNVVLSGTGPLLEERRHRRKRRDGEPGVGERGPNGADGWERHHGVTKPVRRADDKTVHQKFEL
jgi:hypothetical protein